jgi:hypothetical protein
MQDTKFLKQTLPAPKLPKNLPESVQWLAGEGAGSWFYIESNSNEYEFLIQRYSPNGDLECEGLFKYEDEKRSIDLNKPFKFVHLSHCAFVNIRQDETTITLYRKADS